jgi:hypothetical protein
MSQMRDLLREMVTEPVVLPSDAGACRDVRLPGSDLLKSALRRNGRAFEASGEVMSMSRSGVMFLLVKSDRKHGMIP